MNKVAPYPVQTPWRRNYGKSRAVRRKATICLYGQIEVRRLAGSGGKVSGSRNGSGGSQRNGRPRSRGSRPSKL